MDIAILIVTAILILVAGASFLLMIFPAHIFIFLITLAFGIIDGWENLKVWEFLILSGIVILMIIVDYSSGFFGAKFSGATRKSLFWGLAGLIIGLFILPPFGSIIGLFLGVLIGEIVGYKTFSKALKSATGSVLGSVGGLIANLILSFIYLILFILFALK